MAPDHDVSPTAEARPQAPKPRLPFGVITVATSAGGLKALTRLLSGLPADFQTPIVVVQHLDPTHPSHLVGILARTIALKVVQVCEDMALEPGHVYVAPPDHHVIFDARLHLCLTHTSKVHFVRPSADLLFESAAARFGERVIGVVLTGLGVDGASGSHRIKRGGGTVIVQDEASSEFFGMPGAALRAGDVDHVLPLEEIAAALLRLTRREGSSA
jgi:two-component system chemotaxis response regulator CheB